MLAVLALAAATLSACTPEPEPTPTAAFASEEEAFAAAEGVYRAYIENFNSVDLEDPQTFEVLNQYTTGDYQADERTQLSEMYAGEYTRSGDLLIESFIGTEMSDERVKARTCENVSGVVLLDATGQSVVSPDRPVRYALDVTFTKVDGELRIAETVAVQDDACAG